MKSVSVFHMNGKKTTLEKIFRKHCGNMYAEPRVSHMTSVFLRLYTKGKEKKRKKASVQ